MTEVAHRRQHTFHDYLQLEEAANVKHEYLDGEIFAMAGGTPRHAALAMNVGTALNVQLRGKPCRVYSSDLRVRVQATGLATYPDVSVVCGPLEHDPEDENTVTNPVVVVEVLSPSTQDYDRNEKALHFKQIPTLREIVLVGHSERHIEHWSRGVDGRWVMRELRTAGTVHLPSVDCAIDLDDVYRDEIEA